MKTEKILSIIDKFDARLCQRELSGRDITTTECRSFVSSLRKILECE
jgi:hypothetical protein